MPARKLPSHLGLSCLDGHLTDRLVDDLGPQKRSEHSGSGLVGPGTAGEQRRLSKLPRDVRSLKVCEKRLSGSEADPTLEAGQTS